MEGTWFHTREQAHCLAEQVSAAKADAGLVLLCPLASMVPVYRR
jgi:hypothetical protein